MKANKAAERKKKKNTGWNRFYLFRLFTRFFIACYFFGIYLTNRELLDISGFPKWAGLYILAGIILIDFILRFIPLKNHPMGMKKHLKREFLPSLAYKNDPTLTVEDYKEIKKMDRQLLKGCLFYFGITAVFYVLYFLKIFGVPEMLLVMLAYWVGDMICVNLFCPYKLIMKNRCCTNCRIYNWDAFFLVFPLAVVPGLLTWVLLLVAIAYTFLWELNFRMHPERFLERTNMAIRCERCRKDLCPVKRKAFLKACFGRGTEDKREKKVPKR